MADVSTQVSNVRSRFHKDRNGKVISDIRILAYLNEAQDMVESSTLLPASQVSNTITLVADQQEYSLETDNIKITLARYTANDRVLCENTLLNIQTQFTSSTGTPEQYYIWGGSIGFHPTPSANEAAGVKYWYIKTLDELVESSAGTGQVTTSEVPEKFHWVLERGAEMLMSQEIADIERAQVAELKFREGMDQIKSTYNSFTYNMDSTLMPEGSKTGQTYLFNPTAS